MLRENLAHLLKGIEEELPAAIALRHAIHRDPRLSGDEGPTAELIMRALGARAPQLVADTGRIVRIGPSEGPAIGIRAEMDALQVIEQSSVPFASTNGNMHACGHDLHMAGAVALARAAVKVDLPVALVFIFQPREESYPSGAHDVMLSGRLDEHDVRSVIGVHVHPNVARGAITTGAGVVNAASDGFTITVTGNGGHAAYPHKTTDPIVTLAQIIMAAQTIVSRRIDPMHPTVLTFGNLRAGTAGNVIPTAASASGSIRSTDLVDRDLIRRELERIVSLVAEANHCSGQVEVTSGEPLLSNDAQLVGFVDHELQRHGLQLVEPMRSCGSDDFAFYSAAYPSVMMFLGTGSHREGLSLHSPDFCPDDGLVQSVASAFAAGYAGALGNLGLCGAEQAVSTLP